MKDMGIGFPGMTLLNATETDILNPEKIKEEFQEQVIRTRKIQDVRTESDRFLSNAFFMSLANQFSLSSLENLLFNLMVD